MRELADAPETLLVYERETAAPTLSQVGESTHMLITLAVARFASLAIKRKVRTADDEDMTTKRGWSMRQSLTPGDILPRVIYLVRDDARTGTRDVWVRVAHSIGGAYGAESVAQMFTWADDCRRRRGSGDGDPFGGGEYCFSGNVRVQVPKGFFRSGYASFDDLRAKVKAGKDLWIENQDCDQTDDRHGLANLLRGRMRRL